MKRRLVHFCAALLVGMTPSVAADTSATVTEAVNDVSRGSAQATTTEPAPAGTAVPDGEFLKTGIKSRAELKLADTTITRMGANTIFNYSIANNEVDLQAGTILFSKPKNAAPMTIKTASVTAAIVGTTGFVQVHGKITLFGLIEGHATLTVNGQVQKIGSGEILQFRAGAPAQVFAYDIPAMTKSSPLMTQFHSTLPNQLYINKAIAEYDDMVARGFIQPTPPDKLFILSDITIEVPTLPAIVNHDNAGQSLNQFVNPPIPPPPPPPEEEGS